MKTILLTALIVALAAPACAHATNEQGARLSVTFDTGIATGTVMVSLFDSEAAYVGGVPVRRARVDVAKGERTAVFTDLKVGSYAVKAFLDVNADGRMTTNPFGRPIEPFAFSNNARGNMGSPTWDRARLDVQGDAGQTIEVR